MGMPISAMGVGVSTMRELIISAIDQIVSQLYMAGIVLTPVYDWNDRRWRWRPNKRCYCYLVKLMSRAIGTSEHSTIFGRLEITDEGEICFYDFRHHRHHPVISLSDPESIDQLTQQLVSHLGGPFNHDQSPAT